MATVRTGKIKKVLLFLVILFPLLLLNRIIGESLGALGKCTVTYIPEHRVKLFTSCTGPTRSLLEDLLGAVAITVDHAILTHKASLHPDTVRHELAHTRQYAILGSFYLPLYGVAHVASVVDANIKGYKNPHASNLFEVWADRIAGLPPEPKIPM